MTKVFWGTPTKKPVEANYGATQQAGAGAIVAVNRQDLIIGNRDSFNSPAQSDYAMFQWFNTNLSLQDAIEQWYEPHRTPEQRIWHIYDDQPGRVQRDLSGWGNHGVKVAGDTLIEHQDLEQRLDHKDLMEFLDVKAAAAASGRIMSSLAAHGGLAGHGGIAGPGGGLAAKSFDEVRQQHMMQQLLAAENQRKFEGTDGV